jgi:hypothetical protein
LGSQRFVHFDEPVFGRGGVWSELLNAALLFAVDLLGTVKNGCHWFSPGFPLEDSSVSWFKSQPQYGQYRKSRCNGAMALLVAN